MVSRTGGIAAARDLAGLVRGAVLRPGDDGYDGARSLWNGRLDRRPMLIVRATSPLDVSAAVTYARRQDIELSVRSTGHNVTGWAVSDGGLTLDLSALRGVRIDPARRLATVEPGVLWGQFDSAAQAVGLATTGGRISTTGVAGLTLGGGYGWLMRSHGLAADNLARLDLVTADGVARTASATENPDLFWGVRGGGGNFGVATSLQFRLHPVGPRVTGGAAFYPAGQLRRVMRWYRDFMAQAPDELSAQCNVLRMPPAPFIDAELHGRLVVAIAVCHVGTADAAERDLDPMRALGPPLARGIRTMRYTSLQRLYDMAGRFGRCVYGRSGHLPALHDGAIEALAEYAPGIHSTGSIVMISPLGGAVARVGELDTAVSHRCAAFNCAVDAVWTEPREAPASIAWVERTWAALRPFQTGVYVNELGDEGPERIAEAYHPQAWQRLRALKRRYDPDNVFHLNQNVPPAG
ncbi:MAG TPA: FAD-binding oxidoreductase [Rugosimonospora sp.]|nr:FAD-binding oxidoreductase [Rugosimonospora sp.]